MTVKISGTDGIDTAQFRAPDGAPVAITIDNDGKVAFPQTPARGSAFSSGKNALQTINTTMRKVTFQVELLDSDGSFDNSTFTPKVAGWYQINARLQFETTTTYFLAYLFKNNDYYRGFTSIEASGLANPVVMLSELVYMNGTTDYLEIFAKSGSSGNASANSNQYYPCSFSAFFVRES